MTSLNYEQNQIDEESLTQKIITDNAMKSVGWVIFSYLIFLVLNEILFQLGSAFDFSMNLNYRVSSLQMLAYFFNLLCISLYANHRTLQDFKEHNISDVATINYKLVNRTIVFIFSVCLLLLCVFSIIDFMNPPF